MRRYVLCVSPGDGVAGSNTFARTIGPEETYVSSDFGRSNTTRGTHDFAKQDFDRLEDDNADFGRGRHPMNIRQTTDIDVHEEDSIALHTMA